MKGTSPRSPPERSLPWSCVRGDPGELDALRFLTNRFDFAAEFDEVAASLRQLSATMATFYMTGGPTEELNAFLPSGRSAEDIHRHQQLHAGRA